MPNLDGNPAGPTPGDNVLLASFIVDGSQAADAQLANRRILTAGTNVTFTDNGPGDTLVINASGGGGGGGYATIENNGTPVTQRTTLNLSTEFTATDDAGNTETDLALSTAGVAFSKIANGSARSVLGRSANTSGVMASITGAGANTVLVDDGTSLAFAQLAHSALSGLTSGDPHTQYALLAGRSGGQSLIGGTGASEGLNLQSTSNGTRGLVSALDDFYAIRTASGATVTSAAQNQSNTANSHAEVLAQVAGTSAGDARTRWSIGGSVNAVAGLDNDDSDAFVIALGSALGTTNFLRAIAGVTTLQTSTAANVLTLSDSTGWSLGQSQDRILGDASAMGMLCNAGYGVRVNAAGSDNSGNNNVEFVGATGDFGSGVKVLRLNQVTTAPTTNPTAGILIYLDSSGNLLARTSAGNVRTIAAV